MRVQEAANSSPGSEGLTHQQGSGFGSRRGTKAMLIFGQKKLSWRQKSEKYCLYFSIKEELMINLYLILETGYIKLKGLGGISGH